MWIVDLVVGVIGFVLAGTFVFLGSPVIVAQIMLQYREAVSLRLAVQTVLTAPGTAIGVILGCIIDTENEEKYPNNPWIQLIGSMAYWLMLAFVVWRIIAAQSAVPPM